MGRASPAPNKRVDHDIGAVEQSGVERLYRSGEAPAMSAASAGQPRRIAVKTEPTEIAALQRSAGRDEAVAAIIAGPAKYRDRLARRESAARPRRRRRGPAFSIRTAPGTPPSMASLSARPISLGGQKLEHGLSC